MHLTNYSINKANSDFVHNKSAQKDNVGHKRSMTAVFNVNPLIKLKVFTPFLATG